MTAVRRPHRPGGGVLVTPYEVAWRWIGVAEVPGQQHQAQILAWLQAVAPWAQQDEVPWCSAFAAACCRVIGIEHARSARARDWLDVGQEITLEDAQVGFDVVVFRRGAGDQPGPEVRDAPGHVALFHERSAGGWVDVLGGNQGNRVSVASFRAAHVLGVRRLRPEPGTRLLGG